MKKMKVSTLRSISILVIGLIVVVGLFLKIGTGSIGTLSAIGVGSVAAICPLGALETACASIIPGFHFAVRAIIGLVIVIVLGVLFGRFFCAWVCPVPLLQQIFPARKKRAKEIADRKEAVSVEVEKAAEAKENALNKDAALKPNNFSFDSRYAVLLGALAGAAIFGFPVFCLVCPVGLTFASILAFFRLFLAGSADGGVTWGVLIFPAILILEIVLLRKWCTKICPLGALMSLIAGANKFFRPTIDDEKCLMTTKGINCKVCYTSCPMGIDPREPELSPESLNNCSKCLECKDHCPSGAISFPFTAK